MNGMQDVYSRLKKLLHGGVVTTDYLTHENSGLPILGPQSSLMLGVSSGAKPREKIKGIQLRGFCAQRLRINATVAFAFCISMAVGWKFLFAEKRKQKYLDFYKSYDAKADFERMKKAGVFQSVRPDGEIGTLD